MCWLAVGAPSCHQDQPPSSYQLLNYVSLSNSAGVNSSKYFLQLFSQNECKRFGTNDGFGRFENLAKSAEKTAARRTRDLKL